MSPLMVATERDLVQAPDSDNIWVRPDRVSDDGTLHEVPWRRIRGGQS